MLIIIEKAVYFTTMYISQSKNTEYNRVKATTLAISVELKLRLI